MRRLVVSAAVAALAAAAPAVAAPARSFELNDTTTLTKGWTFTGGTGLVGDALVADNAPCTPVVQTCDTTLVHITGDTPSGDLAVTSATSSQTLADVDVYIYESDKDGTQGSELTVANAFSPNESASTGVETGKYYLVKVAYMTGYGDYDGTATYTPYVPEPEDGETE